jgi:hypothetical protein
MTKTIVGALSALMLAGALSAVTGATSVNSVNSVTTVIVIGDGSAPSPMTINEPYGGAVPPTPKTAF